MRRSEQEILEIVYRRSGQIRLRRHALQILAGAAATLVLLTAGPTLVRQLGVQKIDTADQPKTEQASRDETVGPGGPRIPGGLLGPGAGPGELLELLGPGAAPASPGTSPATTMGSSDAQTSGTTGSPPAGSTSQGPAGSLDTTFGTGGKVTTDFGTKGGNGKAMAIQPDGRIVVAGHNGHFACDSGCSADDFPADFALARYNADGSLDTNFGTGGKVTTDFGGGSDEIKAVAIQSDGRIVAAGRSNGDFVLARYNADGSLDSAFGTGGKVTTAMGDSTGVGAVALQSDGRIVAAGRNGGSVDKNDFVLARYNADGSLDSAFGTGGKVTTDFGSGDNANALAIQPDGRIVAAGYTGAPNTHHFAVVRYLG